MPVCTACLCNKFDSVFDSIFDTLRFCLGYSLFMNSMMRRLPNVQYLVVIHQLDVVSSKVDHQLTNRFTAILLALGDPSLLLVESPDSILCQPASRFSQRAGFQSCLGNKRSTHNCSLADSHISVSR